ncbi:MAG TPA: VCBS repeat-containing protein, partial [Thermoanaerobaculia bacterium]|nr:VCBS repeat-containing protein [Thermoanaerobaculia bacterium]
MSKSIATLLLAFALSVSPARAETCRRSPFVADRLITTRMLSIVYGDFNEDGRVDVAVLNSSGSVVVFLNRGGGVYDPAFDSRIVNPSSTSFSGSLVAAVDQNGDGHLDLLLRWNNSIWTATGRGDGSFTDTTRLQIVALSQWRTFDVNGDSRLDFVDYGAQQIRTLLAQSDGTFRESETLDPNHPALAIDRVATGDFDGDGRIDILSVSTSPLGSAFITAFWQNAQHVHERQTFAIESTVKFSAVDLDGDGAMDLVGSEVDGKLATVRLRG